MKGKGFVFSMDTAYAVFIVIMAATTVVMLLETTQQSNEGVLYLSRIAGDIKAVEQAMEAPIDQADINWIKINDCSEAKVVGTHQAVIYDDNGNLVTDTVEVCPQ